MEEGEECLERERESGTIERTIAVAVPPLQSVQASLQVFHPHAELSVSELPQVCVCVRARVWCWMAQDERSTVCAKRVRERDDGTMPAQLLTRW
jgi:hypothetical protein